MINSTIHEPIGKVKEVGGNNFKILLPRHFLHYLLVPAPFL
ncbi:hypothetical protein B4135_1333 [Caldibacillus debilis]|uniref:Uncharacterized protein n=1 Tax=Caldibacillus debilis TaxID=301148 RepID=A0A150MCY8_9BACI|nr:hypothetical protein B4135_1333 [Caldibacillus debilis]